MDVTSGDSSRYFESGSGVRSASERASMSCAIERSGRNPMPTISQVGSSSSGRLNTVERCRKLMP